MRVAIVATPALLRDQRPAPGSLDGDLIRARLSLGDAGYRVIDVDPAQDLAEQLDVLFDEIAVETRRTLVDPEEVPREEGTALYLFYASSPVALSPSGELFLCLDPENPGMGDALSDVAAVFCDRARGPVLFVVECHHAPEAASAAVVAAARRAITSQATGIELLVAAHPLGSLSVHLPSPFTRAFVELLDDADPARGILAEEIFRHVEERQARVGAIACCARVRGRVAFPVISGLGSESDEEAAWPADEGLREGAPPGDGGAALGRGAAQAEGGAAARQEAARQGAAPGEGDAAPGQGATPGAAATPSPVPDDPVAQHLASGDALVAAGNLEGALGAYKKALALVGLAQRDVRAEVHLRIAHVKWRKDLRREAIASFEKVLDLAPEQKAALEALVELHLAERDLEALRTAEERLLLRIESDAERVALLVRLAERRETVAGDVERARELLERALEILPDDAGVLRCLERLCEAAGDTEAAFAARLRLAELLQDPREKALAFLELGRAAMQGEARMTMSELLREERGIELLERALDADPTLLDPLALIAVLLAARQEWGELELAYRRMLDRAQHIADAQVRSDVVFELCRRLGLLFRDHLEDPISALSAFEGAVAERPDDVPSRLSAAALARSAGRLERAAAHLQAAAVLEPGNVQVFHDLFDTFQKLRRPDQSWAAASVAMYLGAAEARERFIFEEHRPTGIVKPANALRPESWELLRASDRDRALEAVLASVTDAAIGARLAQRARENRLPRLDPSLRQDITRSAEPVARSLAWASRYLGVAPPAVYVREDAPLGLAAVIAEEPSVIAGSGVLRRLTPIELAFLVGSHLMYHVGPHRLLLYFPSLDDLGACLAAAIKLARPSVPVPAAMEGPVRALLPLLDGRLTEEARDALVLAVRQLGEIGAPIDLAHWVGSVERCAARAGYLLTGDLSVAASSLARADVPGVLPAEEKVGDLLSFTVSDGYHALREELGIAIEP